MHGFSEKDIQCQSFVHQISSASLQKRTGVFSIEYYLASRTLLWAGHVTRMPKSRLPKRLMLPWVHEPRIAGGQEMTYGRSLERHLNGGLIYFGSSYKHCQHDLADH